MTGVQTCALPICEAAFEIRRGDRVAQLVLAPVTRAMWLPVEELDETARGEGGFGSTGGLFALES